MATSASRLNAWEDPAVLDSVHVLVEKQLLITVHSNDEDLLSAGHLDSLNLVRLISQIEETFRLTLPIGDLGLESFRSVTSISRLLSQRLHATPGAEAPNGTSVRHSLVEDIRKLLEERLSVRAEDIDADLFESGHLDSMSLVQLILELEEHFTLELPIQELDLAEFRSVASIARLISVRKTSLPS